MAACDCWLVRPDLQAFVYTLVEVARVSDIPAHHTLRGARILHDVSAGARRWSSVRRSASKAHSWRPKQPSHPTGSGSRGLSAILGVSTIPEQQPQTSQPMPASRPFCMQRSLGRNQNFGWILSGLQRTVASDGATSVRVRWLSSQGYSLDSRRSRISVPHTS